MSLFEVIAILITVTAAIAWLNKRFLGLPTTIGVLAGGMVVSLGLALGSRFGPYSGVAEELLGTVAFDDLLMGGMLGFLLFAGALHVELEALLQRKWTIVVLATVGTVTSTLLIGFVMRFAVGLVGIDLPLGFALLFGALISPTDPVAVLAILRDAKAPRDLETLVTGESLFNDGVGVVLFAITLGVVVGGESLELGHVAMLFLEEAVGGMLYGIGLGFVAYQALRRIDDYTVEILVTLAVVTGGYALAHALHVSGPLAMVAAGLLIGNHGRRFGMSDRTREHLDPFWIVTDEVLNAVLFVLIGLEMIVLEFQPAFLAAGAIAIVVSLGARLFAVGLPLSLIRLASRMRPYTIRIMTWGGLRGGIAVALALSIPASQHRDLLLVMTYAVVLFSILVQGLTVERLAGRATAD